MTGQVHMFRGRLVHGPYKKSVREEWLRKLLEIQAEINTNGPKEFQTLELITHEELNKIRRIWLDEKHEFDDVLPVIYKKATGKELDLTADDTEASFGSNEWSLLSDVCNDLFPDEELLLEMTASIVDIERKSSDSKKRRGVLGNIESQIKRSFFRDEDDALQYAAIKVKRKKDMGASYDQKAELEDTPDNLFGEEGDV
jgi:DNA sulfur modification protein DndC